MAEDPWAVFGEEDGAADGQMPPTDAQWARPTGAAAATERQVAQHESNRGYYCSTSGTYFSDMESLQEHYRSDYHRYNLKRRAAGLPPVSKEWFETRKTQLVEASRAAASDERRVWVCPLSGKKFASEKTYNAWTNSKKYREFVKKSGGQKPAPEVRELPRESRVPVGQQGAKFEAAAAKFAAVPAKKASAPNADGDTSGSEEDDDSEGWETASEAEVAAAEGSDADMGDGDVQDWEEWDEKRCLFCSRDLEDFAGNLDHMYKEHGFFLPDSEHLADPEGLVKYLGLKVSVGHYPLYVRGDDPDGKQFRSLRATQQHMVDSNKCFMVYEDNEEEYEAYYDYTKGEETQLVQHDFGLTSSGYELVISGPGKGSKIIGSRELLRYYRQRARDPNGAQSAAVTAVVSKYRALSLPTSQTPVERLHVFAQRQQQKLDNRHSRTQISNKGRGNLIRDLPKNVPY